MSRFGTCGGTRTSWYCGDKSQKEAGKAEASFKVGQGFGTCEVDTICLFMTFLISLQSPA
jgi:hypothetical protein